MPTAKCAFDFFVVYLLLKIDKDANIIKNYFFDLEFFYRVPIHLQRKNK